MVVFKTLLFTVLIPGSVTVWFPYLLLSSRLDLRLEFGLARWAGLAPIVIGGLGYLWCAEAFALVGGGTPAPIDPPRTLVVAGPYRFVRNPMYVAVTMVLAGEAIVFESVTLIVYTALVSLGFHLWVVWYEEPNLRRKFGPSYEQYCSVVRRWIPRLRATFQD